MSCLFGKIGWYFLRRLRAWHDFRFKTHSITEATRRNYSKNHTFCDMFSPFCENWFWRETAKIFTFIPVFSTQCPPLLSLFLGLLFHFDGSDLRATCLSQRLIGLIISLLMCEAVSSSHLPIRKPTNALFQIEWRQIIPHWHGCVSVIIIRSYTDHRLLP